MLMKPPIRGDADRATGEHGEGPVAGAGARVAAKQCRSELARARGRLVIDGPLRGLQISRAADPAQTARLSVLRRSTSGMQ